MTAGKAPCRCQSLPFIIPLEYIYGGPLDGVARGAIGQQSPLVSATAEVIK
jgi:hypothetical protein